MLDSVSRPFRVLNYSDGWLAILVIVGSISGRSWGQAPVPATDDRFVVPADTQPAPQGVTTPEAALAALKLPSGFQATLFAAEPAVRQPIAMATDSRGRLWVAENYSYAQHEVNFDSQARDRILVFEDTDRDGRFDRRGIFWDQASRLTSVEVGFGGVWALCPPHLVFLPDRDGDDQPDGPPEVMLDGWDDDAVRHNIANGLRWGPDGWLYGRHGILTTSHVGAPGTPPELRTQINCGMWRFHPTRKVFEVVCHGTTNPWGHDWDQHGQLFFINTVIGHLWHVVPGSHFQRMYGEDLRPNLYELIPQTADHFHWDTVEVWSDIRTKGVTPTTDQAGGGHAHSGMLIYQGGAWPEQYHNSVLTVNLHGRRLNRDRIARAGSGFVGTHESDFLSTTDPWFRGIEVLSGAAGEMYIADWSDIGECHENDGVHRSSGRIFQVRFDGNGTPGSTADTFSAKNPTTSSASADWNRASAEELVAAQRSPNDWQARQARRVLQERAAQGRDLKQAHALLREMLRHESRDVLQLRALWGLYVSGGIDDESLFGLLQYESEHVRAWSVQLLGDRGPISERSKREMVALAERESSGLVLVFLAASLQQLPVAERLGLAGSLAKHANFATDPVLPRLIWYGIEPAVIAHPGPAVELAARSSIPKISEFIARRLTTEIERQPEAVAGLVAALEKPLPAGHQRAILSGMSTALNGWRRAKPPAGWPAAAERLSKSDQAEVVRLVRELSVVFGDGRALEDLWGIARSSSADLESRRAAIRTLTAARAEGLPDLLQKLLADRDLQRDAIRGLAAYHDLRTPQLLVEGFPNLQPAGQTEAINTLASRAAYANVLLSAVAEKKMSREQVSTFHLRQMNLLGDEKITAQIARLWPELQQLSSEKSRRMAEYRGQLDPNQLTAANLSQGRAVYQRVCAACHVLFGEGNIVGPDLTGAQRHNLNYLLENIVDPSATVNENFRLSTVIVADGRIVNGVVSEKTERTITVATPTERLVLSTEEIEEIRPSNLSIMPEGQLDVLSPDQVRNLIAYLMSPGQVALPEER